MRIGFAGAGKMAAAIARGWASGDGGPERMLFCDAGSGRAARSPRRSAGSRSGRSPSSPVRRTWSCSRSSPQRSSRRPSGSERRRRSSRCSERRPWRAFVSGSAGRPVVRLMPTVAVEVRRGVICHAPLDPADGATGSRLLELLRPARAPGRGPRRDARRGDRDHGLHPRLPGGRRPGARRGRGR